MPTISERPGAVRRRHVEVVADGKLQAPRQLLADKSGIAGPKPRPRHFRSIAAAASDRDRWRDREGRKSPPARPRVCVSARPPGRMAVTSGRSRSHAVMALACASSRRIDIDIGGEPAVEPADEGPAEAFDHRADADIDREREQQRHQRQRQSRKLLAAVGPEPDRKRAARAALAGVQAPVPGSRAAPARRQAAWPRARQIPRAANRRTSRKPSARRKHRERSDRLASDQPSALRLMPGIGLRRREHRKAHSLSTGSRAAASSAPNTLMARPATHHSRSERQLPGNLRAIKPAQATRRHRAAAPRRSDSRRPIRSARRRAPAKPVRSPAPC